MIGVFSDSHGDLGAFDAAYELLRAKGAKRFFFLGARYADLNRDLSSPVTADSGRHPLPSPAALAEFFTSAGVGDANQVVAYDEANGAFAARAWWLLNWLGHAQVAVLDGGLAEG